MKIERIILTLLCAISLTAHAQLNTDRITAIGRNALYFEDYVLSIQYFNQVIHLKPYLAEPYFYRSIAKIQLEDYQGALRDCNAAIERNPFSPNIYYARGYVYLHLDQPEKAEKDFTEALHFSPENSTYLLVRADTRMVLKQYNEAMEDIEHLLRREPHSASVWSAKGRICMFRDDTTAAYNAFNQAIELGSQWAGDYLNRGVIQYYRHNYRGALEDYDQAVQLAPKEADCYYNRGIMRQEVGDYNRALEDFNTAITLAPERTEMRYQRGLVELQLRLWKEAIEDMNSLLERYPYFLPAYYVAAQAKTQTGDQVGAYKYRKQAQDLEQQKEQIQARQAQPNTNVVLADAQPHKKDYRKEFTAAAQQRDESEEEQKYNSQTRGTVQKRYHNVVNEPNIVLSYYTQDQSLRRTNYYHPLVDELNKQQVLPAALRFTAQELSLTAEMVDFHFAEINRLTEQMNDVPTAELYFARAVEFAIIKDYASAIDDCTKAFTLTKNDSPLTVIIPFCRANWRYRLEEVDRDLLLRDYDQVLRLQPEFVFALYNKANILCSQHEYNEAINYYTRAIDIDADFSEAYFNRGLTYIYTGENEKGLADLSKAGELGIYQAYNLIARFK